MKRAIITLSVAAALGIFLNSQAQAMTPAHAAAVVSAKQAVAHPGHHSRGYRAPSHHGHHRGHQYRRPQRYYPPIYRGRHRPAVVVPAYPAVGYYPYYYGSQGGIVVQGSGWGFGFSF